MATTRFVRGMGLVFLAGVINRAAILPVCMKNNYIAVVVWHPKRGAAKYQPGCADKQYAVIGRNGLWQSG